MKRGPYHKPDRPVVRRVRWVERYLCEGVYEGTAEDLRKAAFKGNLQPDERQRLNNGKIDVRREYVSKEETPTK